MSSVSSITNNSSTTSASSTSAALPGDDLANEQTFLQLFVAQLKNQDPLDPNSQDPTQMVSELAQFSQLEQSLTLNSTVNNIDSILSTNQTSTATTTSSSTTPTTNSTQSS